MWDAVLTELLAGNHRHTESLPAEYFRDVQKGQQPSIVSVCCSDSRVSQEGMWAVDKPGWMFTPSNIGNQVWDTQDGERIIDGNLLYPLVHTGTETAAIVGHTGCGAVTAAYRSVTGEGGDNNPGIEKYIELLVPVIEEGLESDAVDTAVDDELIRTQLVEFNVNKQIQFLSNADVISDTISIYGFVYDFQGMYGDIAGRTYLVNAQGETDPDAIAAHVPDEYDEWVQSVLS